MNSVFKCLMSAVCAVALPAFGQEEKTGFPTDRAVTVFSAGEGNPYASIRIPALLSIGKGQLLAFAEGRYKNTDQGGERYYHERQQEWREDLVPSPGDSQGPWRHVQ